MLVPSPHIHHSYSLLYLLTTPLLVSNIRLLGVNQSDRSILSSGLKPTLLPSFLYASILSLCHKITRHTQSLSLTTKALFDYLGPRLSLTFKMPPRLELADSNHARILLAPPRMNLRRSKSYNAADRGPLSATSSRFNFNHLLFSPPPSPSLPALVSRPKRSASLSSQILKTRPSRLFRRSFYCVSLILSVYFLGLAVHSHDALPAAWPYFAAEGEYEMVGQDALPDFPTPVVIQDAKGRAKWTISIPRNYDFPLSMQEYADMSSQCREVAARVRNLKASTADQTLMTYDTFDDHYVDVQRAEETGMLTTVSRQALQKGRGQFVGLGMADLKGKPDCKTSMTFVLESEDAGIGNTLMMLWTFYGLATKEGRPFFVDDTRWAYGKYADIFQPPHAPTCRPPPRHHMVPCPFQAQHLVVSAMTAKEIFPALLAKHNRVLGTHDKLHDLWSLARVGYEALFTLSEDDESYVASRVEELKSKARREFTSPDTPVIGVHVRRGDRHPVEYQYRETYIPAEVFQEHTRLATDRHFSNPKPSSSSSSLSSSSGVNRQFVALLASDDPTVHLESDFASMVPAQERIRLASKDAIQKAGQRKTYMRRFVEDAFGWEGGFYAPMFWNLGVDRKNNAANAPDGVEVENVNNAARHMAPPSEQTLQLRSYIGRAYMMDLAVLARASDSIVCTVSAMGCRLLGVMMEWETGVAGGRWVNVDGDYSWTGINWR